MKGMKIKNERWEEKEKNIDGVTMKGHERQEEKEEKRRKGERKTKRRSAGGQDYR